MQYSGQVDRQIPAHLCRQLPMWAPQVVRDDALDLLNAMSARVWKDNGRAAAAVRPGTPLLHGDPLQKAGRAAVITGNLQDAYQDFQLQLSHSLARSPSPPARSLQDLCSNHKDFPWLHRHCMLWK